MQALNTHDARFEVFMAVKVQIEVSWVLTPCGVVDYQSFWGTYSPWRWR